MVSFDVVSLFTNDPLEETTNIIIKRIYDKNEINTSIPKQEMKELLYLCTKNAYFTLNIKTYVQVDGVAIGSPHGPVLANIFMVELEQNISTLSKDTSLWKRYVDDAICFVNSNRISHALESLNSFHSNIKFTVEIEKGNKIAFLDILLIRYKDLINTTVYRKKTNTDLYINWKSFSPNNWKWGTLKTLVSRAYDICSTEKYLKEELNHIETVFKHQNNYPSWVIDKVFKQVQQAQQVPSNTANEKESDNKNIHRLLLPYQGDKGCNIIKSMNKCVNKLLPNNTKIEVAFKSTKLSSCFNVKDKTDFEHNHDLIYHAKCPEPTCIDDYVGESACQITERIKDHNGRNHTLQVWSHSIEKSHKNVNTIDFKIIDKNVHSNNRKRKIKADVEHAREIYPT